MVSCRSTFRVINPSPYVILISSADIKMDFPDIISWDGIDITMLPHPRFLPELSWFLCLLLAAQAAGKNGPVVVDDDEDEEEEEDEKISVPLTITMAIIGLYIFFGALLFGKWSLR